MKTVVIDRKLYDQVKELLFKADYSSIAPLRYDVVIHVGSVVNRFVEAGQPLVEEKKESKKK